MNINKSVGNDGEKTVIKYLKKHKFKIVDTNFSCKFGEIDIIAESEDYIAFIEVKTRAYGQMLEPRCAVDKRKQQRIIKTASIFLYTYENKKQPRFDIAEVIIDQRGKKTINYFENAFWQENDGYA
ncbi:MAG: YraN family protein, partial [Ruminococcus sp.]